MTLVKPDNTQDSPLTSLVDNLGELIRQARLKALRAVDTAQVQTCWQIGRHIVEFEQEGARRAGYGKQLLASLAKALTAKFGKGFDASNLRYMRQFYQAFPICDALRHELSWTHYRRLLRVDNDHARQWYMNESAHQNWSSRALERQINTLYYERLLASRDRSTVRERFSVLEGHEQLFASKYKRVLPSEEELRVELDRERVLLEDRLVKKRR